MQPLEAELEESVVLQKMPHIAAPCIIAKHKVLNFLNTNTKIYFTCYRGRYNFHTTLDIVDYRHYHASNVLNDCFISNDISLTSMQAKFVFDICARVLFITFFMRTHS